MFRYLTLLLLPYAVEEILEPVSGYEMENSYVQSASVKLLMIIRT